MRRLRNFAPQAVRDVEDAADWLADGPGGVLLARRFVAAVIESAGLLGRRPLIGHRRLELLPDPFRFYTVKGFSYLMVYNSERPTLRVLRVLHMARDLAPLLAEFWDETADDTPPVIGPQSER